MQTNSVYLGDCLELMQDIPNGSIDMILCDLPYGMTACKWDVAIPFEQLWNEYKRIIKPNGAIVLFGNEPFSSLLRISNLKQYKYDWKWIKNIPSGFQLAKTQPMRAYEDIMVFYRRNATYNKQPTKSNINDRKIKIGASNGAKSLKKTSEQFPNFKQLGHVFHENVNPRNVLNINCVPRATGYLHPTQKPVALFEYLIKTYTNEGETVLDNCAGSGTTAIACLNTNRKYILMEKEKHYYDIINKRILDHTNLFTEAHK